MHQDLPEHVQKNRIAWDTWAAEYAEWAPRAWAHGAPTWGIFQAPEAELERLPGIGGGSGCHRAGLWHRYISAWLARHGARSESGSTTRQLSSRPPAACRSSSGSSSRSTLGMPRKSSCRMRSLRLRHEYGASHCAIPTAGFEGAHALRPGGNWLITAAAEADTLMRSGDPARVVPGSAHRDAPVERMTGRSVNLVHRDWIRLLQRTVSIVIS